MTGVGAFLGLSTAAIAASAIAVPRQLKSLASMGRPLPGPPQFAILQTSILSGFASGVGAAAIYGGDIPLTFIKSEKTFTGIDAYLSFLAPTLVITIIAFCGHLVIYYVIFRPRLNTEDVLTGEEMRLRMGLLARILQGGIVEEVEFRWGLMTLMAWVSMRIMRMQTEPSIWLAILLSALIFGAFHLIGSFQLGMNKEPPGKALTILDNFWVGLAFGWLFWQYGLLAAMISHAVLHVLWSPIEKILLERYKNKYVG